MTRKTKLDIFTKNENWRTIIDKFIALWTQYFEFKTEVNKNGSWEYKLRVEGEGVLIEFERTRGNKYAYGPVLTVSTRLHISSIPPRKGIRRRLKKSVPHMALILRHEEDIAEKCINKDFPQHHWRRPSERSRWKVVNADFDYLSSTPAAIKLLRSCVVETKVEQDAYLEGSKVFDEYLDGMAEVLTGEPS